MCQKCVKMCQKWPPKVDLSTILSKMCQKWPKYTVLSGGESQGGREYPWFASELPNVYHWFWKNSLFLHQNTTSFCPKTDFLCHFLFKNRLFRVKKHTFTEKPHIYWKNDLCGTSNTSPKWSKNTLLHQNTTYIEKWPPNSGQNR